MPQSKRADANVSISIDGKQVGLSVQAEGHTVETAFTTRHAQARGTIARPGTLWHDGWEGLADQWLTLRLVWTGGRSWLVEFTDEKDDGPVLARGEFVVGDEDREKMEELDAAWSPVSWG